MTALPFLDTNVFLRHLVQDHDDQSPRATLYINRIEHDGLRVETTATVVFETVFTLQSFYKHPRPQIRDNVLPLLRLPDIALPGKRRLRRAFDLYTSTNLSFADCLHVAIAEARRVPEFVSFDRGPGSGWNQRDAVSANLRDATRQARRVPGCGDHASHLRRDRP